MQKESRQQTTRGLWTVQNRLMLVQLDVAVGRDRFPEVIFGLHPGAVTHGRTEGNDVH